MSGLCVLEHGRGANGEPFDREAEVGLLCLQHRGRLTSVVMGVAELWTDLALIIENGSAPKDDAPKTRHLKSAEAPAPANLEALALRDTSSSSTRLPMTRYAVLWDGSIARVARRGDPPKPGEVDDRDPRIKRIRASAGDDTTPIPSVPTHVRETLERVAEERPITSDLPNTVVGACNLLVRHHDWLAEQDWVEDYLTEFVDLRKALTQALRDHMYRRIGTCRLPAEDRDGLCGGALLEENGGDGIRCAQCRATWTTPTERARLAITLEGA